MIEADRDFSPAQTWEKPNRVRGEFTDKYLVRTLDQEAIPVAPLAARDRGSWYSRGECKLQVPEL